MQPDAPRVGGITPFLQIMNLADFKGLKLESGCLFEMPIPGPSEEPAA